ncbi:MAG TPA: TonB-dependent receptor plug domain-containing protein, partial [Caulobacteraceae bacterium]
MKRFRYFGGGSLLAIAMTLGMGQAAAAQDAGGATELEAIVVTGSLIRGTPEDAALPVDVISQEDLEKQGSPSTTELIKALPVSNGVLGDTNQFDSRAQGSEGSGSVNLRGLGPTRTLVLVNGKRLAINPFALAGAGAVDTNTIPAAAIGRVEVLKDGAAATYGSDAIGGVVNFITRSGFEGVEVGGSYRWIDGSDGDYTTHVNLGKAWDRLDVFASFSYQHRSELSMTERDWAIRPLPENPEGGWSAAGNPSSFIAVGALSSRFRDTQCAALGGFEGFSGFTPVCNWQYTKYDNLVEEEDRYQAYAEANFQATDTTKAHFEVLWSSTDVPHWKTSPSYALLSVPTASVGSVFANYFVPANNPGLIAYMAANPSIPATNSTTGADTVVPGAALAGGALLIASRPYAIGGNPMFGYGASEGKREFDAWRFSGDLTGEFDNGITWQLGVTHAWEEGVRTGYDTVVNRYQLALRGYGSLASDPEGCTSAETAGWTTGAGNASLGCYFFNPFSSAIPQNVFTGQTTPQHSTALENSADLTRWFFVQQWIKAKASVTTFDALVSGEFHFE